MVRELWAKLHVELLDDEKLFTRSDSDFRLWVSLILFARANGDDGVVRGLDAERMRRRLWLKSSPAKIQQALDHFATQKMITIEPDGAIRLLNFGKRQAVMDHKERNAERQRRYRERNVTSNGHGNVTADVTVTTEEKRLEEKRSPLGPLKGAIRLRRSSEKPKAEPTCTGCRTAGHWFADCPRKAEYESQ